MLYTSKISPAYHLRYGWTAWPSAPPLPPLPTGPDWETLLAAWEKDGLRVLEHNHSPEQIQITFSARPDIAPEFLAARAKGRLQHACRQAGSPVKFSRKLAVRAIGNNTRRTVEQYVREQLERAELADETYRQRMTEQGFRDPSCHLEKPSETNSGRYWYNLHLVFVVAERFRMGSGQTPATLREACIETVREHGGSIAELSVMPDHLHIALRANPAESPETIAQAVLNNTAERVGRVRFWEEGYYAGTFGEYTMRAVRS